MLKLETIRRDWKQAGSFPAHLNLFGFWDEVSFLTKSGDLGTALAISGVDYESLDQSGRDYVAKRLEAAFRTLSHKTRLYQILFRRNRPQIPRQDYEDPLVQGAVSERLAFLESKADRLYRIEIYWVLMIDSNYTRRSLLDALAELPKHPRRSARELRSLVSGSRQRTLLYEQIERDRLLLSQQVQSLTQQLSDLTTVELLGAEKAFRLIRRLVNFRPSKIEQSRLHSPGHLDFQTCDSELEAHRGYLSLDQDYVRVLTLKELPSETRPLLLNGLLDIPANFHVVTEWHPVDNASARGEINKRRRHYHNSKTSFLSNLQDRENSGPRDELVDDSKQAAVAELGEALTAIGLEGKSFGEFTLTVVIYDDNRFQVERAVAEFQKLFTQHDGGLYEERYNLLNAFFATVPGNRHFNLRQQWALNSNYADLSFLFTVDGGSCWNPHLEREYALFEGTMIDTALVNRLDGEFAGPVKVMVTNPVYSLDRQHVLIPEGTFILGEAQKVAGFGQKRLALIFHRLIMPDGYSVDLDQFHGLDQAGETGLKDQVNNHYLEIFGASLALGVIAGAAEASTNAGYAASGSDVYRQGVASSLSQSGGKALDRFINIPPTITIREGHRVKVYLTQDLLLPAYENHAVEGV